MRILQVVHNYPPEFRGGVERAVELLAAGLAGRGHAVSVFCGSERPADDTPRLEEETREGCCVLRARRHRPWAQPVDPFEPEIPGLFARALDRVRPEVVHVHHWWNLGDDLVRRATARGLPVVVTLHDDFTSCSLFFRMPGGSEPCDRPQGAEACAPCIGGRFGLDEEETAFFADMRRVSFRSELLAACRVFAPSKAQALRLGAAHGVDVEPLPLGSVPLEAPPRRPPAFPGGPLRILHFGNLSRLKGVELLLEAVEAADPGGAGIQVVLAGELLEADLHTGRARVHGRYEADQLEELAAAADLAVFPSLARESYGMVVDEALRLGLPVLVSDRGALAERVGGRGLAFPVEEPGPLAQLLRSFLEDPGRLAALQAAPPPELWTPEDNARALEEAYRACQGRPLPRVDLEGPLLQRVARCRLRLQEAMDLVARGVQDRRP